MKDSENKKAVIITGSAGGIGKAIVHEMQRLNFFTIGIDVVEESWSDVYLQWDLYELVNSNKNQIQFTIELEKTLESYTLHGLINNAACQILGSITSLSLDNLRRSFDINTAAPFLLSKLCLQKLEQAHGSIINISSIHSTLTKPQFLAYATSKGALDSLTKALSIDIGNRVKVVGIAPAAIETDMLKAGFAHQPEKLDLLKQYHPTKSLGQANEIAQLCRFLLTDAAPFMNGTIIHIDGGISNQLHDPD